MLWAQLQELGKHGKEVRKGTAKETAEQDAEEKWKVKELPTKSLMAPTVAYGSSK